MKLLFSLVIGAIATYAALIFAVSNLGAVSSTACPAEFTLPALACGFAALGLTVLAVPFCGIVASVAAWIFLGRALRKQAGATHARNER